MPALFKPQKTESWQSMGRGYQQIFSHPHFWRVAPLAMITQGGFMAFHGLWIGPWFTRVVGVDNSQAALGMFWISLALMTGYALLGFVTRRVAKAGKDEDQIMLVGLGLSLIVMAFQIVMAEHSSLWGWIVHGLLLSSGIMTYSTCNKPFPKYLTGRSSTALNLMIFIGAFSAQWGIGLVIDALMAAGWSETAAFKGSLTLLLVLMVASWLWYARPGRKISHLNVLNKA